jgi:hypothetical protein
MMAPGTPAQPGLGLVPPLIFAHPASLQCLEGAPGCVALLHTPVTAGTVLLNHVDTVNNTASGAAVHRREYFAFSISQEGAVQSRSTPCFDPDSPLADPSLARYAQVAGCNGWRV